MAKDGPIPYYLRIAETLKTRIQKGIYQVGDLIPPSRKLEEEFRVSNITVRKALELLVREGLVVSKRGIGTEVAQPEKNFVTLQGTGNIGDWVDSAAGKRLKFKPKILEMKITSAPLRVRLILDLKPEEAVWRMTRIYTTQGRPMSYFINYCRPGLFVEKVSKQEVKKKSFIEVFQERCHIKLLKIEQRLEATVADMDLSTILDIHFGSPVFFLEHVYYSMERKPVEVSHVYFRGDRYIYKSTINMDKNTEKDQI